MSQATSAAYKLVQHVSVMAQDYYPEALGQLLIINAPWTFATVWSIIKGWLGERTRKKI